MTAERGNFTSKASLKLEDAPPKKMPPAFHLMIKPSGAICNLDCTYCFYLRKEFLYKPSSKFAMSDEVLESLTRQYIQGQQAPEATFGWQGGEPTLMGLNFFRKAVEFQKKYRKPGMRIANAFQTNGVLLNDEWCQFFKAHNFLVGLSLDGPKELHNSYRIDKGGNATFDKVYKALKLLQKHQVDFNVLCVVNRRNGDYPLKVYRFLKSEGVQFIQFIPAVERKPEGGVTEWTVRASQWGKFLCDVFDEWIREDVGRIYVQHFDVALESWSGYKPSLCVHAETCGNCLATEHNGDLFACDHYVDPDFFLGNYLETPMEDLVASSFQRKFGQDKHDTLPKYCLECPVKFACNGGCPKDRFIKTPAGDFGLNYLCEGYKRFFTHIDSYMKFMAFELMDGRPAANVMEFAKKRKLKPAINRSPKGDPN